jgi:3-isopropylmalate/(R)-2-methylmalate dehydratase large subunit
LIEVGQTLAEKILANHTVSGKAIAGEIIEAEIDLIMVHEVLGSRIIPILTRMDFEKVWDSNKVLVVNDHWVPASDIKSAQIHQRNREFVKNQDIPHFCDIECGICHQILPELGLAKPGDLIIGSDSHSTSYGAFNAFSTGLAATDSALILATGKSWFKVPESIHVQINGKLSDFVMSKDIILKLISDLGTDGANYCSIEFYGPVVERMSIASRLTMCNMSVEAGAKCAIMTVNNAVRSWLSERAPSASWNELKPDEDAEYRDHIIFNLNKDQLNPIVATPHSPANGKPVSEVSGVKIDQAFIGSCTNGRFEDLEIAYRILKGKKIHKDVRLIITPASTETYMSALKAGFIEEFINVGAVVTNSTCGACVGGHLGVLGPGEVCISSSNRNFRGRMGHQDSEIYLASPATVAASALKGEITDPRGV